MLGFHSVAGIPYCRRCPYCVLYVYSILFELVKERCFQLLIKYFCVSFVDYHVAAKYLKKD